MNPDGYPVLTNNQSLPVLDLSHLSVRLALPRTKKWSFFRPSIPESGPWLVSDVSLTLFPGERVGFVGPSGSGKTVTAFTLAGVHKEWGMEISYQRFVRPTAPGNIAMIFQEPRTALNPYIPIGKQFNDLWRLFNPKISKVQSQEKDMELLYNLGLPDPKAILASYPGEISGGQCQRVALAQALISQPKLLIADEPTSSIDTGMRRLVLDLLYQVTQEPKGPALLFISHDPLVVQEFCSRIVPIQAGKTGPSQNCTPTGRISLARHSHGDQGSKPGSSALPPLDPIISIRDGRFRYPNRRDWALDQINLTIYPGERVGIVGESGGGKTTLFKLISGIYVSEPSGKVEIDGKNLAQLTSTQRLEVSTILQTMFQDPRSSLSPWLSHFVTLFEPLDVQNVSLSVAREKIEQQVREVSLDIPRILERKPDQLSGGQRQRIAIARSLTVQPRVLLADEPFSALDPQVRTSILELVLELQRIHQFTLVLVSHNLEVIHQSCQRVIVLDQGKIVDDLPSHEFFDNHTIRSEASNRLLDHLYWKPRSQSNQLLPGDEP